MGADAIQAEKMTKSEKKKLEKGLKEGSISRAVINSLKKKYGLNMGLSDEEVRKFSPYERKKYELDVIAPEEDIEDIFQ